MENTKIKLLVLGVVATVFNLLNQSYAEPAPPQKTIQDKTATAIIQPTEKTGDTSKTMSPPMKNDVSDNSTPKVNINTATAEQLAKALQGIGMKKAEAIINYREQYGVFTNLEQLKEVPGIGPVFLERNLFKMTL